MKRLALLTALLTAIVAVPAGAQVPSTMSYQGVLTDGAGNLVADGPYNLTFKLYNVAVLGAPLWTETQVGVTVTHGGFAAILGSITPITLPFDRPYWLGIAVGANPEMTPRVTLASSPYGLSLRLPFSGTASSASPSLAIQNTGGGPAITADPRLNVGTSAADGFFNLYSGGVLGAQMYDYVPGAALELYDYSGSETLRLEPDANGGGAGFFQVRGGAGLGFLVDGNATASKSAYVYITGANSSTIFNTDATGDASVVLPANSVSSSEILDEPGISQGRASSSVYTTNTQFVDAASTSITIPAPGYITLDGDGQLNCYNTTAANYVWVQITTTTPGSSDAHYGLAGASAYPGTSDNYSLIHQQRTYYESAAGTYTFYFQLKKMTADGSAYIYQPTLRATYYPVSYGTVTTIASGPQLSAFSARQALVTDDASRQPAADGALVDLRELELKVVRERADLEQAQRQLLEARLAQQRPRAAAARPGK